MRRAIYPGSFDPVTYGHLDIITRASQLTDELIIGVLNNKKKTPLFSVQERVRMIEEATRNIDNVKVIPFEGLLVDFAKITDATMVVRGLRAITDFENELSMAQTNHILLPSLETVFLTTSLEYSYLSSTVVKEVVAFGGDISHFVPKHVEDRMIEKYKMKEKA